MNPLQPMINALASAFRALMQFLGDVFVNAFSGFVTMFEFLAAWFVAFFRNLFGYIVDLVVRVGESVVSWLPDMPAGLPEAPSVAPDLLVVANRYIPVAEAMGLGISWAVLFAALLTYKGAKFLRGGG